MDEKTEKLLKDHGFFKELKARGMYPNKGKANVKHVSLKDDGRCLVAANVLRNGSRKTVYMGLFKNLYLACIVAIELDKKLSGTMKEIDSWVRWFRENCMFVTKRVTVKVVLKRYKEELNAINKYFENLTSKEKIAMAIELIISTNTGFDNEDVKRVMEENDRLRKEIASFKEYSSKINQFFGEHEAPTGGAGK